MSKHCQSTESMSSHKIRHLTKANRGKQRQKRTVESIKHIEEKVTKQTKYYLEKKLKTQEITNENMKRLEKAKYVEEKWENKP